MKDLQALERQNALRALLASPLLLASRPAFVYVRRHQDWLRGWFQKHPGWALQVDSEFARLRKNPGRLDDATHPAVHRKVRFTRRHYVLFCLALAALERADRQTTLGRMADAVVRLADGLAETGFAFTLTGQSQRRELVAVARFLMELRVLLKVDGDEQHYVEEAGDVLYTVNRPVLAALLSVRRGPSTLDEPALEALVEEPLPQSEEGRNRRLRTRLFRRLLDDPVVYYEDLEEDERAYLVSQRPHLVKVLEEDLGLVAEARREGLAMVDPEEELTDLAFPEDGTDGHAALLLADFLARHARQEPGLPVGRAALEHHMAELVAQYRTWWRSDAAEPGGEARLVESALERLEALGLVRVAPEGVLPRAALGRYAAAPPREPAPRKSVQEVLLFE